MKKEEILKFYQNHRLYIFPLAVVFSSLILIVFVIYPQMVKFISNYKVEREIIDKSKFLESKVRSLESYDSADLNRKVEFALNSYSIDKDFINAVGLLQNLTAQSGFSITSMSLGGNSQKKENAQDQSYSIKLEITGPTTQLPALLSSIDSSPRLMRVSSMDTVLEKDPKSAVISLNVEVLYSAAPKDIGDIYAPLPSLSEQDEEIIAKLAGLSSQANFQQPVVQSGPRGKENPFE